MAGVYVQVQNALEANPKTQIPNPKTQVPTRHELGSWDLSWDLELGIWDLGFRNYQPLGDVPSPVTMIPCSACDRTELVDRTCARSVYSPAARFLNWIV
jgi:hypothetical protein